MSIWLLLFFALITADVVLAAGYMLYVFYALHKGNLT